jgi:predicted nucleic acid-binding protein
MENAWRSWRLGETASVDSNILIYAGAEDAGDKTQTARKLLRELGLRHGVVAVQALGEFFVNAVRRYRINLDDALHAIVLWQSAFTTIAAQPAALVHAIRLVRRFDLQFWDAMLIATLAENGVRVLFSEDLQDGQTIDGVLIINPFGQDT